METLIPGIVIGFREGLEAFLVVAVALRFLERSGRGEARKAVWTGAAAGVVLSFGFGAALFAAADALGGAGFAAKLWESGASIAATLLVGTFIVWMIRHGAEMTGAVERGVAAKAGALGIGLVILAMVLREGVEIALFAFAGTYPLAGIALGLVGALVLVYLVFASLVRVNLSAIFNATLVYLILQAGFLLGYGIHEGLSALKESGALDPSSPLLAKAFDLSKTILDHKQGPLGLPLYALVGWYSRPEWVQFAAQYLFTLSLFGYWALDAARRRARAKAAASMTDGER